MPRFCRQNGSTPTNLSVSAFYLPKVNVAAPRKAERLERKAHAENAQAQCDQTGWIAKSAATNNSFEPWKIDRDKKLGLFPKKYPVQR
jgi:hypothetical protein